MPQPSLTGVPSLLALLFTVPTLACEPAEKQEEIVVLSVRNPCIGLAPAMCLSYRDAEGEVHGHYGFKGFTHRWGVETRLRYHEELLDEPLLDGPDRYSVVDEIISETVEPVGTQFELSFPEHAPNNGWFAASGDHLNMVGTEVVCDAEVCTDVLDRTAAGTGFSATFELTGDELLPLRLLSVTE